VDGIEGQSTNKKLRFQPKTDTCGRGLRPKYFKKIKKPIDEISSKYVGHVIAHSLYVKKAVFKDSLHLPDLANACLSPIVFYPDHRVAK